jgi:nucleotide-binding universal stress UspA family protein
MPKPIVVALDPDHEDDAPLIAGTRLATLTGAPVMVVGAYLHDPITNAVSGGVAEAELRADILQRLEARTGRSDVGDLMIIGGPSPARVLHDTATRFDASALVVGSTRRGAVGRVAPGTTAERLLHGSPCPVLVAPAGLPPDWAIRRVGAGFVESEDGRAGLRVAAGLAAAGGASLRVMTVVEPTEWNRSAAIPVYGGGGAEETTRIAQRALDRALAELPASAQATGELAAAHPADALAGLSGEVDLLVCGSRGYGPLRAVLLGGVTHPLLRKAECPVLVVPRGAGETLIDTAQRAEAATTGSGAAGP